MDDNSVEKFIQAIDKVYREYGMGIDTESHAGLVIGVYDDWHTRALKYAQIETPLQEV